MRVMTWNVWWRFGNDWGERQRAIVSALRDVRPDVVGLQEVWATADNDQPKVLGHWLGMQSACAFPSLPCPPSPPESPDQAGVEVGVGVLSRWPIVHSQEVRLPSGHREHVAALLVGIDHPQGALHVVSCCLDWGQQFGEHRMAQARALAELVTDGCVDGHLPVLLTGDLNAPPASPEVELLTGVMVDTWLAAANPADRGESLSSDNPLASKSVWQIDQRIDYVLARPGTSGHPVVVEHAFVARDMPDAAYASDHYAVVADIRP